MLDRLPGRATLVDLGSGTGRPVAETFAAAGHDVTGYDVSAKMVEIAREQVPAARFAQADLRELTRPPGSADVVTAFFSLLQMTRAEIDAVLAKAASWLAPGGHFVLGTVAADADGVEFAFLGHPIRASSYPAETFAARLASAGLEIVYQEQVRYESPIPRSVRKTRSTSSRAALRESIVASTPHRADHPADMNFAQVRACPGPLDPS